MKTTVNIRRFGRLAVDAACAMICGMSFVACGEDETASAAAAAAIKVDSRSGECRATAPCSIEYDPAWCGVASNGSYVIVEKVEHAGMFNAVTSTVATLAADVAGSYSYAIGDGDVRSVRFIHRVCSAEDVEIGEPLVRDVAFGYRSAEGAAFAADSRTNSLQIVASAKLPIDLTYSTEWTTDVASVAISAISLSGKGGEATATNTVFSAAADAEGTTPLGNVGIGWRRLLYRLADGSGNTLLEYLTDEFKMPGGFVLIVK